MVPFGVQLAPSFIGNRFQQLQTKCPARLERHPMQMPGGSQTGTLACVFLKQEKTTRAQIPKTAARAHVVSSKMLFDLAFIANVPKSVRRK